MTATATYHEASASASVNRMEAGVALLRFTLGSLLLAHGLLKVLVFTVTGTVAYFESIGLPPIVAYLTMFGELVGGTALLLGLYTRLAAPLTIPLLVGAAWAHSANGWVFSNAGGGWEFPAFLAMMALVLSITGGGAFALRRFPVIDAIIPNIFKD